MGIKDLLRFMIPYIQPVHIKKYAGKRVGIDAYSWLHKGAYSCSMELCMDSDSERKWRYADYFMNRVNLLRFYKIIPVVVFDGGNIPCKAGTETERHRRRKTNCELAMAKLNEGDIRAATELFQRAVNVTPAMAHHLIQILRSENIEFVVAPYEADAQLAYLSSIEVDKGGIAAVITEDSDLMPYGCQAIIFKMDRYGNGEEILLDNVFGSVESTTPSFRHFTDELFRGMCILAGCDFLPSIPGIGIAKAYSLVSKYRNLDRALSVLKVQKRSQIPEDYAKSFKQALAVFQHARIYDAKTKMIKHMKPLSEPLLKFFDGDLDFLGPYIPSSVAIAIAEGKLDPTTMEAFDVFVIQKPKPAVLLRQEDSSYVVFSTHSIGDDDCADEVSKTDEVSTESKFIREAAALEKLITPSKSQSTVESIITSDHIPLKTPDNNPFKKKKAKKTSPEKASIVSRNENEMRADCISVELSIVTEIGNSDMAEVENSQESINSKPKRMLDEETTEKPKSKRSNLKGIRNKKSSILNFFSPRNPC